MCQHGPRGHGRHRTLGRLAAGFPDSVPAVTINRFCASSLTGAINIAHAIRSDELGVGLAAGVESMSPSGWAQMKGDAPFSPRGPVLLLDTMWAGAGVRPTRAAGPQRLRRDDQDGTERGRPLRADPRGDRRFRAAIAPAGGGRPRLGPVGLRDPSRSRSPATRKQPGRTFEHDEGIRGDTTAEQLAALPPQPNTTQMTAGNSSPLSDGASAVVLASGAAAE